MLSKSLRAIPAWFFVLSTDEPTLPIGQHAGIIGMRSCIARIRNSAGGIAMLVEVWVAKKTTQHEWDMDG